MRWNIFKLLTLTIFFCSISLHSAIGQKIGVKTNLLYGGVAFAPNLGVEIGLGKKGTLDLGAGYNWFTHQVNEESNRKLIHWLGQIEYRYWLCERFNGHFFGVHILGSQYNIAEHELPLLFGKGSKNYRYEGWAAGVGISYGYQFILGKRWNLEANIGVGYARLEYGQFECKHCGDKIGTMGRNYFGPTKAAISLIYLIK